MKVNRYQYGQTNVRELQAKRDVAISPKEAGEAAGAKYVATAQVSGDIAQDLFRLQAENKRLSAIEDAQTNKMLHMSQKAGLAGIKTDPANNDQLQEDGTPTASYMLEDFEGVAESSRAMLEDISDPKARQRMSEMLEMQITLDRIDLRNEVNKRREKWNIVGDYDLLELAVEGQDFSFAYGHLETMRHEYDMPQRTYDVTRNRIKKEELDYESNVILESFEAAALEGKEHEFYAQLNANDTLSPELKTLSIAKVENRLINMEKIRNKAAAMKKTEMIGRMTSMRMAQKQGQAMPETIEEFTLAGMGISDSMDQQMMQWRNELYLGSISAVKTDEAYQLFKQNYSTDILQVPNAANEKFLDRMIEEAVIPGMNEGQIGELSIEMQTRAGFPSFKTKQFFSTAPVSDKHLAAAAPLWGRLMLNPDVSRSMTTDLDDVTQTMLTETYRNIETGIDPLEAAQMGILIGEKWDQDKDAMQAVQNTYTSKESPDDDFGYGETQARESFDSLIDQMLYGTPMDNMWTFWSEEWDDTDEGKAAKEIAFAQYERRYHKAYSIATNTETAALQANRQFVSEFSPNNLNGKWRVERNGAKGNIKERGEDYIEENGTEQVIFTDPGGNVTGGALSDLGNINYRNPTDTPDGKQYEIWEGNSPLTQDKESTFDGKKVVSREGVYITIKAEPQNTVEVERIREESDKKIDTLQKQYERAQRHLETTNPYDRDTSAERVRNIPNKIRLLQEQRDKDVSRAVPEM